MDESIIYLKEKFSLPQVDIQTYSPLTLAYIGDAAYELVVRTFLVDQGNSRPDKLHRKASSMVKAAAQAAMAEALKDSLTEEELSVYRRGRNANPPPWPKMPACPITGRPRGLRHSWAICT